MANAPSSPGRFLTAQWRWLAMLNFEVDPAALLSLVPTGTEIDFWNGRTFLSMVGFRFEGTRVLGLPIPWHRHFDEVNLRFYVRRRDGDRWRRGVVFIKEIVPRRLIAWAARTFYNEPYVALPMRSHVELPQAGVRATGLVRYEWQHGTSWQSLSADIAGEPQPMAAGSEEEFITEHYWGYVRQRDQSTVEYQVEHPPWRVWRATAARLECDVGGLYGADFVPFLTGKPSSAFVAEGSEVLVRRGRKV